MELRLRFFWLRANALGSTHADSVGLKLALHISQFALIKINTWDVATVQTDML